MIVQICIGSSCFLRGSEAIVDQAKKAIEDHHLEGYVILTGSFCSGKCNRDGVTIRIDDEVYTGITPETFPTFFEKHVLSRAAKEGLN